MICSYRKINRFLDRDYSRVGFYYITINIHKNGFKFSSIYNGKLMMNKYGKIASEYWNEIHKHYPECITHEYVIMPDHIHGIIEIKEYKGDIDFFMDRSKRHAHRLACIIGSYKSAVSRKIHKMGNMGFKWQRSFYDRVMRITEHDRIEQYIQNNPKQAALKKTQ